MASTWYSVYKVRSKMGFPDPHMPPGRLHHAIFVQTTKDEGGMVYHVTGDITSRGGMVYESKPDQNPELSDTFHSLELLGYTSSDNHPDKWNRVLSALPTPPQQKAANPKNGGSVEPFKQKISDYEHIFYAPGEKHKPLWKCTEWVELYAIPALQKNNLIQQKKGR
ncbi:hypothetical protein FPOA_03819 [Fusarium poae]|uniref:Uncharacterized protein n=1 Tax=Fusarium poae TaxID=36050 RepID=A0A1B8AS08_FUSPO|nr:hypothetical protein FPOA_03819 [Fusarium poae]